MKDGAVNPDQPLVGILNDVRSRMEDGDCLCVCRDPGSHNAETCKLNCPGPDQPGTICMLVDHDDPRSSAEIAAEIEPLH